MPVRAARPPRTLGVAVTLSVLCLLGGLLWAPTIAVGNGVSTRYVAPLPTPIGDGSSCASPGFNAIQSAVDAAIPGDTIHLCAGIHALTSKVTAGFALTFEGDGAALSIVDGGGTTPLFEMASSGMAVTDVTLQNGSSQGAGGAIYSMGTVTVTRSVVRDNQSFNDGAGVLGFGVVIIDSTFDNNHARGGTGGAVAANASGAIVVGSTFSNNSIGQLSPFFIGFGSAINSTGDLTVTNTTFTDNSAIPTATIVAGGPATITNSTFGGNTALGQSAIVADGGLTLTNTVVGDATASANCSIAGVFVDGGGNFSTDGSCGLPVSRVVTPSDLALQPLADNGGLTETMALGAGSVAIDAGVSIGCPATDQRGITRPQGPACDSGAFELVPAPPPPQPAPTPLPVTLTKGVASTAAGPFAAGLTAPLGSTVWYRLILTNTGMSSLGGISLADLASPGALPAECPALPAALAGGGSYTCTYPATVTATATNTATATVSGRSLAAVATVTVGPPVLADSIAPGVNRGTTGFKTASLILDRPGYVTYRVQVEPTLAGRAVEIWTRTKTGSWIRTTTRLVANDGTVHYYRRILGWTGFWAKLADGSSHGRIGTVR